MAVANVFNSSGGTAITSTTRQKDLSAQTDGSKTQFTVPDNFVTCSLVVYWNGLRQFTGISITIDSNSTFTTSFVAAADDYIFVDYQPI